MATEQTPDVSETAKAKSFLKFQYVEIKDLSKQFLTVVAAVLALSVTFSEKIVNFTQAGTASRVLMMACWGLCLFAFVLGGCAIFILYNVGVRAKDTVLYKTLHPYRLWLWRSYLCLDAAGIAFVLALILLVVAGFLRILK